MFKRKGDVIRFSGETVVDSYDISSYGFYSFKNITIFLNNFIQINKDTLNICDLFDFSLEISSFK